MHFQAGPVAVSQGLHCCPDQLFSADYWLLSTVQVGTGGKRWTCGILMFMLVSRMKLMLWDFMHSVFNLRAVLKTLVKDKTGEQIRRDLQGPRVLGVKTPDARQPGVWTSIQRSPSFFGNSLKHAWTRSMNKKRPASRACLWIPVVIHENFIKASRSSQNSGIHYGQSYHVTQIHEKISSVSCKLQTCVKA